MARIEKRRIFIEVGGVRYGAENGLELEAVPDLMPWALEQLRLDGGAPVFNKIVVRAGGVVVYEGKDQPQVQESEQEVVYIFP